MKKFLLALSALVASGSLFAQDVLFINADADSKLMTVKYRFCANYYQPSTSLPEQSVTLKGKFSTGAGKSFVRVVSNKGYQTYVTSVSSTFEHSDPITVVFGVDNRTECKSYDVPKVAFKFDSNETDTILCNNSDNLGNTMSKVNTRG